ncbi:MAG: hypothetical protein AAFU64_10125, partial [Bacteroidota bacterium]
MRSNFIFQFRLVFLMLFSLTSVLAQNDQLGFAGSVYRNQITDTLRGQETSLSLPLPDINASVKKAMVFVRLDLGENYTLGDIDFSVFASMALQFKQSERLMSFRLNSKEPEALFYLDVTKHLDDQLTSFDLVLDRGFGIQVNSSDSDAIQTYIENNLRVSLSYEVDYQINPVGITPSNLNIEIAEGEKVASFSWNSEYTPQYQFQLLRLYNIDTNRREEQSIQAEVDWSQALTLDYENRSDVDQIGENTFDLTIAAGTGFYIWRLRPIGSLPGGITNPENYGEWTSPWNDPLLILSTSTTSDNVLQTTTNITFAPNNPYSGLFFHDPDEDINSIYARTFTEENRVSESITYANGLNQAKQSQTFLPSQENTITTQSIYDYSGRPSINTLPVPQASEGLNGYRANFVRSATDSSLYRDKDFDEADKINNPAQILEDGNFDYYAGRNNVASAEGYAYSRVLYYDDGTNRVKEQSGVGKTHMIGEGGENQ